VIRLAGVALDARFHTSDDLHERADIARWIAGNVLAARGVPLVRAIAQPAGARVVALPASNLRGVLTAIAAAPALVDPSTLPRRWRLALRALGMPVLDRPVRDAIAAGVSVVSILV
jgi:hypothetical protein